MRRRYRSVRANAYLWGHVYARMATRTGRAPQEIHDVMCQWFLTGVPTGRTVVRDVPHTHTLSPAAFNTFVADVRLFAKALLGVETDDPDYPRFGQVPW